MQITDLISESRLRIESTLVEFFDAHQPDPVFTDSSSTEIYQILRNFTLRGGKRIRPILTVLGFRFCADDDTSNIWKPACSVEMLQSYLLIHDDIMDQSLLRRGAPTVHKEYESIYHDSHNAALLGISAAIIAGNIANHLGNLAIVESVFPSENRLHALAEYNHTPINVGYGQLMDLFFPNRTHISFSDLYKVYHLKTATYSVSGPLRIGARLAGASDAQLLLLSKFGDNLGKAFQIKDDIVGLFGDETKTGKQNKSDISEGKKTLMVVHAMQNGSTSTVNTISSLLGKAEISDTELELFRESLVSSGSLAYAEKIVTERTDEALSTLAASSDLSANYQIIEYFEQLAWYLLNRNS